MQRFVNDYMEGAHPAILEALARTNMEKAAGYGLDPYCESAREKIRAACNAPQAEVHFLVGGTQANETVISTYLRPWQGVVSAESGHINVHEAGAVEHGGHKVLALPGREGKLAAGDVAELARLFAADANNEHEVEPALVYISQPTEYGTVYSLAELEALRAVCDEHGLGLFIDGARLGYALAARGNDATLADIARVSDVFYIGGTKVGALFGEAVVFPKPGTIPHFYTMTKQHGAMLAKGRALGVQFDVLFTDGLYVRIARNANACADRIREALVQRGYELYMENPTNQVMVAIEAGDAERLAENVEYGFMETLPDGRLVIRLCTSWATKEEDVDALIALL